VTDGDIFNDKTKVKHVFVDGRWFPIHEETKTEKPGDKTGGGSDDEDYTDGHSRNHEGAGR